MKKYELTDETIYAYGETLHRIKALVDFSNVKAGDLGGYVESYDNLSQEGECWIYGNAMVSDNAEVFGDARVFGDAIVFGDARVFGNAMVSDNAEVFGDAIVFGYALVSYNSKITATSDYIAIGPIGSRNNFTTFYKCSDGLIRVNCGCFNGTLDRFLNKVSETHGNSKYAKEYKAACALAAIHIE